jgi:hypothetical protein
MRRYNFEHNESCGDLAGTPQSTKDGLFPNSELQNQGSKTLNWATLEPETDRVFLCIVGVVPTVQKISAHQSANETRISKEEELERKENGKEGKREAVNFSKLMTEQRSFIHLSKKDNTFAWDFVKTKEVLIDYLVSII